MKDFMQALRMFLWMMILTGLIYPLFITLFAKLTVPQKSSGDFIELDGKIIGSTLIAQQFSSEKYFWARPSAVNYNPLPSGGSNYGPTSAALIKAVEERRKNLKAVGIKIPSDLLYASGSGLDPHITPEAAYFQAERIAKARGIGKDKVEDLIQKNIEFPRFALIGKSIVNVLLLNLELDKIK